MIQSRKLGLYLFSNFLLIGGLVFFLEGQFVLGWKTGAGFLLYGTVAVIDFYQEKTRVWKLFWSTACLFCLFLAIKNFLAP